MNNILITGGSGLIGTRLTELLLERGHQVSHLSRSKKAGKVKTFIWDIKAKKIEPNALLNADTIIHLAGVNLADKRWTKSFKKEILDSRVMSARLLNDELKKGNNNVKTFISASGISYYGVDDNETIFTEDDKPANDFLALVVKQWEAEADQIATLGFRVVKIRTGIVLSEKEGVLKEIARPVKYFVGASIGSGNQNLSWIHIDDLCRMYIKAIEDPNMKGAYNGGGPYPVTNRELTRAIAKVLHRPLFLPGVPVFILKILFGEMGELVVKGNKISSEKIQREGFEYKFKDLESAIRDLLLNVLVLLLWF